MYFTSITTCYISVHQISVHVHIINFENNKSSYPR